MPEVLTETETGPSLLDRWNATCEKYGVVEFSNEFFAAIRDGHRVEQAMPIAIRSMEIKRAEREVIEAAKAWNSTNHRDTLKCEEQLARLGDAVDALIEFESSQQQIKK